MNHYGKLINCIATGFSFSSRTLTTLIMSCEPVCHQDIRVSVIYMFICCLLSCKSSCHSLTFEFISFSASKNDTCFLPDFKMVLSYKSCYHHHLMQMKSLPDFGVQMDTTVAVTDSKSFSLVVFFQRNMEYNSCLVLRVSRQIVCLHLPLSCFRRWFFSEIRSSLSS